MSDAARRAIVDELERVFREFAEFARLLPRDLYDVPVPGEEGSVRAILGHVVRAGYSHVTYVAEHAGGRVPERKFPEPDAIDDPQTWVAALHDVVRFAREALDGVADAALAARFTTRWGQNYDGEQMMEHATCHPGRHVRQLRRWLHGGRIPPAAKESADRLGE